MALQPIKKSAGIALMILLLIPASLFAQDDLDDLLDDLSEEVQTKSYVIGTFKSPRVINSPSVEMVASGALEFRISHRFGRLNTGSYNFWGLDQSTIRLGLDYGITDWFSVGAGRSSFEKTYDGSVKFRLLRQTEGAKGFNIPVSISLVNGIQLRGQDFIDDRFNDQFSNRLSYYHLLVIGRKVSNRISLQLTGAMTMENFVQTNFDENLRYAVGGSGRFKLTNRIAVTGEYFYRIPHSNSDFAPSYADYNNSLSLGFDIETGGHVFQLHFTNSLPMNERGFLNETTGSWMDGDIHFGFNITREFTLRSNN